MRVKVTVNSCSPIDASPYPRPISPATANPPHLSTNHIHGGMEGSRVSTPYLLSAVRAADLFRGVHECGDSAKVGQKLFHTTYMYMYSPQVCTISRNAVERSWYGPSVVHTCTCTFLRTSALEQAGVQQLGFGSCSRAVVCAVNINIHGEDMWSFSWTGVDFSSETVALASCGRCRSSRALGSPSSTVEVGVLIPDSFMCMQAVR